MRNHPSSKSLYLPKTNQPNEIFPEHLDIPQPLQQPQAIEVIKFTPGCPQIIFMLPFPFFCIGCSSCMSMTTILSFDNLNQSLNLISYPGYCRCCAKQRSIPYSQIRGSLCENNPNMRINKRPAYQLVLSTYEGNFQLTGAKMMDEVQELKQQLDACLKRCMIQSKL